MREELEALKPAGNDPDMARWNVEDLQEYVAKMKVEITRVEAIIDDKQSVSQAAAALFGSSD